MESLGSGAEVRVLGSVRVVGPAGAAELVGARQRVLVGLLALSPGSVVSGARLVDGLWGEDPPRTALRSLQSHVVRVRQALRACWLPEVLITRDPGYLLAVERSDVDACRFEDAVHHGRAGDAAGLRAGLALWRGMVFGGDAVWGWAARELDRLAELRLTALEDLWDLELRLGGHAGAVDELERLLAAEPGRERLTGLLMLALYRCGRSADALDRYERFRRRLVDDLGADPGPQLRRLHVAILRGDPALEPEPPQPGFAASARIVPAQLPPPVGHFAGREAELAAFEDARMMLVSGTAGVGKTALAVQWANRERARFPDGQIFLDLRGHDPDAALTTEATLCHVLAAMGVPRDRIPAEAAEQTALYRSLVHDRRVLVVLDNAGTADQVLPLVPTGANGMLLVTSRRRLAALAVHHAVRAVELTALRRDDALAVVAEVIGPARLRREPLAANRIVELCDRLPLALRIAAAKLAARPLRPLADLMTELSGDDRLDALTVDGDSPGVRTVFASAYRGLRDPAARLLRLLGLHPGATFTADLVAALAGIPRAAAGQGLDELSATHLIIELGGGHYRFHDLIRLYAAERVRAHESPRQRAEILARLMDWYVALAAAANHTLDPARDRVRLDARHTRIEIPAVATHSAALARLDGEHANLMAVVHHAYRHGRDEAAWQLCYLLAGYFESRGHYRDRVIAYRWGLAAAQRTGDPATEGLMRSGLGMACVAARRYPQALDHLRHALALAVGSGDRRGEGHVRNNLAVVFGELRRFPEAIEAAEHALAVHTSNGHSHGITLALNNLGCAHARAGRLEPAIAQLCRGLAIARQDGDARLEAAILHNMGEAHQRASQHATALDYFNQALELRRRQGDRRYEARTLTEIGTTHLRAGHPAAAVRAFRSAQALSRRIGDQHLDALLLANLGQAHLEGGDLAEAGRHLECATLLRTRVPDRYEQARIHASLAELAERFRSPGAASEERARAIELFESVDAVAEAAQLASGVNT